MLGYIAGWAAAGFGVRCYQLAIMKRNIFENLGGHALSSSAFAGLGYYLYHSQNEQRKQIEFKKDQLLISRERQARLAEEHAQHDEAHH
ncbi:hypothetical protein OIV83_005798 [Microbotryomycetes sp. JL201]|nr:hypothetical protein OIV83_005798 [Microbotryomycetes sp. JL201]